MVLTKKDDHYTQLLRKLNQKPVNATHIRNISIHNFNDIVRMKQSTSEQIKLQGLSDYYDMRKEWNILLKLALGIILAFNILLVIAVGLNWLHYSDEWFLRIVLTTNLADILGLVYLVVKFLFTDRPFDNEGKKDQEINSKKK